LPFKRLCIVDLHDAGGNREEFGQFRCLKAPGSCDDFKPIFAGPNGDGLNEAMLPDALG
jgi:hypothetical protein